MHSEIEKHVNLVKNEIGNFDLVDCFSLAHPIFKRLAALTENSSLQSKVLDWNIEEKKVIIAKCLEDIESLKMEKMKAEAEIENARNALLEELAEKRGKMEEKKAALVRKERELELKMQEFEKKQYMAKVA